MLVMITRSATWRYGQIDLQIGGPHRSCSRPASVGEQAVCSFASRLSHHELTICQATAETDDCRMHACSVRIAGFALPWKLQHLPYVGSSCIVQIAWLALPGCNDRCRRTQVIGVARSGTFLIANIATGSQWSDSLLCRVVGKLGCHPIMLACLDKTTLPRHDCTPSRQGQKASQ